MTARLNPPKTALIGKALELAKLSEQQNWALPDQANEDQLNRILWHDARGWDTPYPAVRSSLFFPLSIDIADDEREEKEDR